MPTFLADDFLVVGFFSEAATLAVVFFFAWRLALPEARLAAAFFVVMPSLFLAFFFAAFFLVVFLVVAFFFTGDFFTAGFLTTVERLSVLLFLRFACRPRLTGADIASEDASPMSMSMPKTDES